MFVRLSDGRIVNASKIVVIYPPTDDLTRIVCGSKTDKSIALFRAVVDWPEVPFLEDEDGDATDNIDWEEVDDDQDLGQDIEYIHLTPDDLQMLLTAIEKTEGLL